jgi:hypothetical protein
MDTIMGTSPQVLETNTALFCADPSSLPAEVTTPDNSTPDRAENRCFYCRLPLSQCKNQEHWNKLLKSRGQDFNRGMSIDNQNLIYTNEFQAAFDKKDSDREADPEDRSGHKTPTGAGPDTAIHPVAEWFFGSQVKKEVAKNDCKYWEYRLKKKTAANACVFFSAGQDWAILKFHEFEIISAKIQSTIQEWLPGFPEYMQNVLTQDWQERGWLHPSDTPASYRGQSSDQTITVECRCGTTEQRAIKSFQESNPALSVPFSCIACSGLLIGDFHYRQRPKSTISAPEPKKRASRKKAGYDPADAPQPWDFDTYVSRVVAAGGYNKQQTVEYRQRKLARISCDSPTLLINKQQRKNMTYC